MKPIHINRNILSKIIIKIELIGFADAACSTAYSCCLYLRTTDTSGNVKVSLLCSKSRVSPINKKLTTPKLELYAALLLAKLANRVYSILGLKIKVENVYL